MSPPYRTRRQIRIPGYDYRTPGAYFITIVTQGRAPRFGQIDGGALSHTPAGAMVDQHWRDIPQQFPSVTLDSAIIMPDHMHAILWLGGDVALGGVIGAFKSLTTNAYIQGVRQLGWPPFQQHLWQRGYHEQIIRTPDTLDTICRYIQDNPTAKRSP